MAPVRKKKTAPAIEGSAQTKTQHGDSDYDTAIIKLKTTLDGMGYTSPDKLKPAKITPESLEVQMQDYLERTKQTFASAPKRSGAMYRVAFRRILWTARATEEEKKSQPERMTCNYWSNKAIAAREAKEEGVSTAAPAARTAGQVGRDFPNKERGRTAGSFDFKKEK